MLFQDLPAPLTRYTYQQDVCCRIWLWQMHMESSSASPRLYPLSQSLYPLSVSPRLIPYNPVSVVSPSLSPSRSSLIVSLLYLRLSTSLSISLRLSISPYLSSPSVSLSPSPSPSYLFPLYWCSTATSGIWICLRRQRTRAGRCNKINHENIDNLYDTFLRNA